MLKRVYTANPKAFDAAVKWKYFLDKKLGVTVVDNGIMLPARPKVGGKAGEMEGGVCDSDLKFVAGYFRGAGSLRSAYEVERETIEHLDEDVIYGGVVVGHFGHFMAECLVKLWYVIQHPELKHRVAVLISSGGRKPWQESLYELMGIPAERIIYVERPTQFRSIIVPDESLVEWKHFFKEYLIPYHYMRDHVEAANVKKLYLSKIAFNKAKEGGFHVFGEEYFEDFFAKHGYTVVSLEQLPMREQLALLKGADEIVCIQGTLSHWALLCRPKTKITILNKTDSPLPLQCLINEASEVDWCIVNTARNFMYAQRLIGVCMVGVTKQWQEFVMDRFGEHVSEDNNIFLQKSLDEYIGYWCKRYVRTKHLVDSLKDMCNRIIKLEKRLAVERPSLCYETHLAQKGWLPSTAENDIGGVLDRKLNVQAVKIYFKPQYYDVYYSVYYPTEGWTDEVATNQMSGTVGKSKPIMGIKIRLDETGADKFNILYRVHNFKGEWSPWAKNAEELISSDAQLNAIQIKLEDKFLAPPCEFCNTTVICSTLRQLEQAA